MSSWKDISPTADQRALLGTAFKLIHDPYNFSRYIAMGGSYALVCDNAVASTPVWSAYNIAPTGIASNPNPDQPTGSPWGWTFNFATGEHGWYLNGNGYWGAFGSYVGGTGWESAPGGGETQALGIRIDFENGVTIDEMVISKFQAVSPLVGGGAKDEVRWVDSGGGTTIAFFMTDTLGTDTTTYLPSPSITWNGINIIIGDQNAAHGPHYFYSVTIRGSGTPPILPGNSPKVAFADLTGTIAGRGRFYWLANDGANVYIAKTTNYFQSVSFSGSVAPYTAGMNYSISPNSYNANSIDFSAGTRVYTSSDGGETFSATTATLTSGGGAIAVPYSLGGTANAATPPQFFAITGSSGSATLCRTPGGAVGTVFSSGSNIVPTHGVGQLTIDANVTTAVSTAGSLAISANAGATWTLASGTIPINAGTVNGLSGLPNRGSALMVYGKNTLAITDNAGGTYFDVWTDSYASFATSTYGASAATNIVSAQIRLDVLYSAPVTS